MNKRILIVDDDSNIRGLIRAHLTRAGYEVFEAGDGAEALAWFENNSARLAIVDVVMPEMNGVELAYKLNLRYPKMPILAISAGSNHVSKELCLKLVDKVGVADTMAKPFEMEELVEKVNALLRRHVPQPLETNLSPNSTFPMLWDGLVIPSQG